MMRLTWRPAAYEDRAAIMDYIATDNPVAALALDELIEDKVNALLTYPQRGRPGRVKGTREMVVHPNYLVVYQENSKAKTVTVLRVLHAAQRWPTP